MKSAQEHRELSNVQRNVDAAAMLPALVSGRPDADRGAESDTLVRAQSGELEAQSDLIRGHERAVFALLGRLVGADRALVEDLAQETFLRVLARLPDYQQDGRARLSTWILTIASNLAVDELRRRGRRKMLPAGCNLAGTAATDEAAVRRQLAAAVSRAVEELPPVFRAAFVLREYHQLSYAEVATALEVDVGTVKSRLARARERLRELLKEVHHAR